MAVDLSTGPDVATPATTATRLASVAVYVPEHSYSLEDIAEVLGLTARELKRYRRFMGLDRVRWDPAARQSDLLVSAARLLPDLSNVRYVIHARTIEPTGPYSVNALHVATRELGLGHVPAFGLSQHACASGLLGIDLAGRMLRADGDPNGQVLLLTGEKTYPHVARYMPASTVMGEASAACLVGLGGGHDRLVAFETRTLGAFNDFGADSGELIAEFERSYPDTLAGLLRTVTEKAGVALGDVRQILPHNINRISWVRVCQVLGLPVDRVLLDTIPVTGHCFCADSFVNYAHALSRGLLRRGDHYLMASVGLGATFSAMLFKH
ncbi:3-oxoacyl-ACP synthase [Amycolatopsis sp. WAC 04169]|uniref:3-oxoacyl-[acyl-carrier-protein] synthase III C-terminal domain-containing protein n=1 Tax=Amycolatopsis sp. WAC 04169 TaxID=2203197 RepID=UPI000F76DB34|nr:3-oxoacyl-[acyl-carrier-protein] synthase III C-terminal domain-containing protein [Amycolatopsis sp. WAC 04169]RSN29164.1 3-oxoacyl-ACP synthase [Amycolatopsis sp. WAC 04169]